MLICQFGKKTQTIKDFRLKSIIPTTIFEGVY